MTDPASSGVVRVRDLEATLDDRVFAHPGSRLLRRRRMLTLVVVLVVGGSVGVSAGYALYLRSDLYHRTFLARLSERLGVTVDCRDVRRLGHGGHELLDTRVSLDAGGSSVFACDRAVWQAGDQTLARGFVLDLIGGWILVGSADWPKSQYTQLLRTSLGQDFSAMRLGQVRVRDVDIRFAAPFGQLTAGATRGVINVTESGEAVASLDSFVLNGVAVDEPVNIAARFTPGANLQFSEVRLSIPSVPVAALGLADPMAAAQAEGTFSGTITYGRDSEGISVDLSGALRDADLVMLTAKLEGGPYRGHLDVRLRDVNITNRKLTKLYASGRVADFHVGDVLPELASIDTPATLTLDVDDLQWHEHAIRYMQASGAATGLSLDAVTRLVGPGRITGTIRVDIVELRIVDDKIARAVFVVEAVQPKDGPGLIDRSVLAYAATRWLGLNVGSFLPSAIEYERLGARFIIEGDELRVEGTHGVDSRIILTARVFGRSFAVVPAPDRVFEAPDLLAAFRDRARDIDRDDVRSWWDALRSGDGSTADSESR